MVKLFSVLVVLNGIFWGLLYISNLGTPTQSVLEPAPQAGRNYEIFFVDSGLTDGTSCAMFQVTPCGVSFDECTDNVMRLCLKNVYIRKIEETQ